jgi:hypothetical protein
VSIASLVEQYGYVAVLVGTFRASIGCLRDTRRR